MHLGVFASERKPDEIALIDALRESPGVDVTVLSKRESTLIGALRESPGVSVELFNEQLEVKCDLYCIIGVKHAKRMRALNIREKPFLFWDKGYNRQWPKWWRVAYCNHQPTRYLMRREFDSKRAKKQGWLKFKPWRAPGDGSILFAGASGKYHAYFGLPEPDAYAAGVLEDVRRFTGREFIYRPKPSYAAACPIEGARFSRTRAFTPDLDKAAVMITHGSGACLDAVLEGVPAVVLGDGVTRAISSTELVDVEAPRLADDAERRQVLSALAYFQWSVDEIARGDLWPVIDWVRKCT